MPAANTATHYGAVTKTFHWLTALLIFTAIPLGVIAHDMPYDTAEQLARKAQLFSLHKTIGVLAFLTAGLRILWALAQPKPAPLHPDRRVETWAAEAAHWTLYASLVIVPLSGWIHHAATTGFAPLLLPVGDDLPLVPKSPAVAAVFGGIHDVTTKILFAAIALHVLGALKHLVIDRDATLARMLPGRPDLPKLAPTSTARGPLVAALAIYALGLAGGTVLGLAEEGEGYAAPTLAAVESDWTVTEGSLGITVTQFGNAVEGRFADWTAAIAFAETPTDGKHGTVEVTISIPSLTLGSVTQQAMGPDYFAAEDHPTATFTADILPADTGYIADGTLTLKGATVPLTLPFTLEIEGDTATMSGTTTVDRTAFGIGSPDPEGQNLAHAVTITADLTATRSAE